MSPLPSWLPGRSSPEPKKMSGGGGDRRQVRLPCPKGHPSPRGVARVVPALPCGYGRVVMVNRSEHANDAGRFQPGEGGKPHDQTADGGIIVEHEHTHGHTVSLTSGSGLSGTCGLPWPG